MLKSKIKVIRESSMAEMEDKTNEFLSNLASNNVKDIRYHYDKKLFDVFDAIIWYQE
jgi:hypothetical protein